MRGRRYRLRLALAVLAAGMIAPQAPALAQDAQDKWSFVLTPQVWVSHIALNGFASAPNTSSAGQFLIANPISPFDAEIVSQPFPTTSTTNDKISPQWGIQLAAQKGRWTFAAGFQYVNFDTKNLITYKNTTDLCGFTTCISPGQLWANEFVNTTRYDVDLTASYFFPDVVKDRVDASLGLGFKFIYAAASRQYRDMNQVAADINAVSPGLYTICPQEQCPFPNSHNRVSEYSQIYGLSIPMNLTTHLTSDSKWLLPLSITPMLGAEHRNDVNVAYSINYPQLVSQLNDNPPTVNRQDGTKFAYGFTGDLTIRYIINDMFSAYAGMRVQYIKGFDKYLAYGPLFGLSARFGGK